MRFRVCLKILYFFTIPFFIKSTVEQDKELLQELTQTFSCLLARAVLLDPSLSNSSAKSASSVRFTLWPEKDHSVIQLPVLDQFLTVNEFVKKPIEDVNAFIATKTLFSSDENSNFTLEKKVEKRLYSLKNLQEKLLDKLKKGTVNPSLNIGGGMESCGYQAIKNAILISTYSDQEPYLYSMLTDLIYANELFGRASINQILTITNSQGLIDNGLWRSMVIEHRIKLKELSISNAKKAAEKALTTIQVLMESLSQEINNFTKFTTWENKRKIIDIWSQISTLAQKISSETLDAQKKAKEISTPIGNLTADQAAHLSVEAQKLLVFAKNAIKNQAAIDVGMVTVEVEEDDEPDYEEYFESDIDDELSEEELDSDVEEEKSVFDDEKDLPSDTSTKSIQNEPNIPTSPLESLEESERAGDYLNVSDIDFLYTTLQKTMPLPDHTIIGTGELGLGQVGDELYLEKNKPIEQETANELFDSIIKELSQDKKQQHVVFVGEGNHWVTVVIKIIDKKLYYIITDSANQQQYGLNLSTKGNLMAHAIKKIINGTKDSLLKLLK